MTPRFIDANGLRFAYLEQGRGPLVLLVHGFPDTALTWDRALPALAEAGFRAVAPFQRGYVPTEIPADGAYDIETLAKDIIGLIGALGADQAIVVGHDWGAAAAYLAASLAPERLQLLVTLAIPHPRSVRPTPGLLWAVRHFATLRRKGAAERIRRGELAYIDELWRRWSPAWKSIPASETEAVKAAFREPGCLEAAVAYYGAQRFRPPAALRQPIQVPAVAFAGEHDIISPRAYEKARLCFAASYEIIQVPGGHFMHREHPEPFLHELVRVVREHAALRAAPARSGE